MKNQPNWSLEQQSIFTFFSEGIGNLIIRARAGTGKTTTIKAAFEHAQDAQILYAVFNKRNQKEAQSKISDPRVQVKTLHSLGLMYIKVKWPGVRIDENSDVEFDRAQRTAALAGLGQDKEFIATLCKLVSFVKNTTINPTRDQIVDIAMEKDLLLGSREFDDTLVTACQNHLALSKEKDSLNRISFDDMVWLPVAMGWVKGWFNLVVVDEAQDMNQPQLTMARQACKAGGRVVVVGDDRQCIYVFRGALLNSMQTMKIMLRASELGLTTTYRCPKKVVNLAQTIVPDYRAADTAPEGDVTNISESKLELEVKIGDAILSRLNAPLMPIALQLIRKSIPARIEGRDIGRQLIGMVVSMRAKSVPDFIGRVTAWAEKQRARLGKARNSEKKIEQVGDLEQTLCAIAQVAHSVDDITNRIKGLFQDTDENSRPAVVLSTVHKAKGLEWPRVFMLNETFRKGKGIEEDNIWYVAVTRAQKSLYFVGGSSAGGEAVDSRAHHNPAMPAVPVTGGPADALEPVPTPVPVVISNREPPVPGVSEIAQKLDNYGLPVGMVYHERGNIISYSGAQMVCEKVNDCSAKFVYLKDRARSERFSASTFPTEIIRQMDETELDNFLTRGIRRVAESSTNNGSENENNMKKEEKISPSTSGRSGQLLGFSVSSVIRALAKAGATKDQIGGMLGRRRIKVSPITLGVQYDSGVGGFYRGEPAPLSKDQIKELVPNIGSEPASSKSKTPARPTKSKAPAKKPAAAKKTDEKKHSSPPARPAPAATPPPAAAEAPAETQAA